MSKAEAKTNALIEYLNRLAAQPNRAALSELRAGLQQPNPSMKGLRQVINYVHIPPDASESLRIRMEEDAILLGGLFATHPESGTQSLGAALKAVKQKTGSGSIQNRFEALISADREDLPYHLRYSISLISSHGIGIDWLDTYNAIRYWDGNRSRRKWARDFYLSNDDTNTDTNTDTI